MRARGEHKIKDSSRLDQFLAVAFVRQRTHRDRSVANDLRVRRHHHDLCLSVFTWAPFRKAKAAVKLHTLLDIRGNIPRFIHITDGKLHEVNTLDVLPVQAGAFYLVDRGYLDFARLYAINEAGAFFVTQAKSTYAVLAKYAERFCAESDDSPLKNVVELLAKNAYRRGIYCIVCY